jgi:hypothetical protein
MAEQAPVSQLSQPTLDEDMAAFHADTKALDKQAEASEAIARAAQMQGLTIGAKADARHADIEHAAERQRAYNTAYIDAKEANHDEFGPLVDGNPDLFDVVAQKEGERAAARVDRGRGFREAHDADNWRSTVATLDAAYDAAEKSDDWSEFDTYFEAMRGKEKEAYTQYRGDLEAAASQQEATRTTPDTDQTSTSDGDEGGDATPDVQPMPDNEASTTDTEPGDPNDLDVPPSLDEWRARNMPKGRARPAAEAVPELTREQMDAFFGTAPTTGEALQAKIAGMELSLERLARAKKAVEMGVGRRDREGKLTELEDAQAEVRGLIDGESLSDAEKIELKFAAMQRVAELQVENSDVPKRMHVMLQRLGNSRIMQAFKRNKVLVYGAAAVAALGLAVATVASGGAAAAATLTAVGLGVAKGSFLGGLTGGSMGAYGARATRHLAHTADATQIRTTAQLEGWRPQDGETYEQYAQRVHEGLYGDASAMYDQNTLARRRSIGRGALTGVVTGAVTGALGGSIHAAHFGGVEHTTTTTQPLTPTPGQIHDGIQHIVDNDPSQLHQVPGLEHVNTNFGDLSHQAAGTHHGQYLWTAVQNNGSEHLSNAATQSEILDGMSKLHDAGFHIDTHGAIHWDANADHYVTTGDKWNFGSGSVHAPQGGAYVIGPDGNPHLFTGALNNGQQAALLDLLHQNGTQVMNHDQFVNYLSSHVSPNAANADIPGVEHATTTTHTVVPHEVDNGVWGTAINPATTAADVAAAAAMTTPEVAPSAVPFPEVWNRFYTEYEQDMRQIPDLDTLDEDELAERKEAELRQLGARHYTEIKGLNTPAWAAMVDALAQRTNLDKKTVRRTLKASR